MKSSVDTFHLLFTCNGENNACESLDCLLIIFFKKDSDILVYFVVELGDAFVCPVFSKLRQNMTQSIRPAGDRQ